MQESCITLDQLLPGDPPRRPQSAREERANTITAALGLLGAVGLTVYFCNRGFVIPGQWIYCTALIVLYVASTVYHALPIGPAKKWARAADRIAIFALIAGTYTPFAVGPLWKHPGILLLLAEWLLALLGILFVATGGISRQRLSNAMYIIMGWLGLAFAHAISREVPPAGVTWLVTGGIVYTTGVIFYSAKRLPFSHSIWHLFVIGGSLCHALSILTLP